MTQQIFGENCISSDDTVNNLPNKTNCIANANVKFNNTNNYHLSSSDVDAIFNGKDLSSDYYYIFKQDIDNDTIINNWPIGSDSKVRKIVFSVSNSTDFIASNITISNGLATFSTPQTGSYFGIGHVVNYSSGKIAYIIEKISTSIWRIALANGTAPGDELASVSVNSVTPAFPYLMSAISGATSGIYTLLGNQNNLITLNLSVDIACYNIEDSGNVATDTWTTDAIRNINIYAPYNVNYQCNVSQKFSTKSGNGYKMYSSISIHSKYTKIYGIQIYHSQNKGIEFINADGSSIENCLIYAYLGHGISFTTTTQEMNFIINNLIYNCGSDGININDSSPTNNNYYLYNNTTINCANGVSCSTLNNINISAYIKNHISQYNKNKDYYNVNAQARNILITDSVSSDSSVNDFINTNNKSNINLEFLDYSHENFNLTCVDSYKVGYGEDLSCDRYFPFNTDINNNIRLSGYWYPGVDGVSLKNEVFYSVGKNVSCLNNLGTTLSIIDGIAYFNNPQTNKLIGTGDVVTYNTNFTCYLAAKINEYIWRVVTILGTKPNNINNSEVISIKRTFNSLENALTQSSDSSHLNSSNLVNLNVALNLVCYNDGIDNTPVSIFGWITDPINCIKIYSNNRHKGTWSDAYTLAPVTASDALYINAGNIVIDGLQINSYPGKNGISLAQNINIIIKNNIIKNAAIGIYDINNSSHNGAKIINNIIYDCSVSGIDAKSDVQYNNTVVNCVVGFNNNSNSLLKNNLSYNNSNKDFNYNINIYNCTSKDSTAGANNDCNSNATINFVDYLHKNYNLLRVDTAATNQGLDLSLDNIYPFKTDILNRIITSWCIGAFSPTFETINLFFSVGQNLTDHKSGINTTITISNGLATFSTNQSSQNLGIGDQINYHPTQKKCYIVGKISLNQWLVLDKYGKVPDNINYAQLNFITHTFSSLGSALLTLPSLINTKDLISAKFNITLSCYDDGTADTSSTIISLWNTDKNNTITIRPANNIVTECNKSQKHVGAYGGGYRIEKTDKNNSIHIINDNIVIDGLQISPDVSYAGVFFSKAAESIVKNCIIKNAYYGISYDDGHDSVNYLINNIIYSCTIGINPNFSWVLYNNTVTNCSNLGINNIYSNTIIYNTICYNNNPDFLHNYTLHYCFSKDTTAGTSYGCNTVALTFAGLDFHLLQSDTSVRGVALNLNNDTTFPFNYDACGNIREQAWDAGALEFSAFKNIYYSIGQNADDHKTGDATILIVSGIATFYPDQASAHLGVGDEVTYNSNLKCYLKQKFSNSTWSVVDKLGNSPDNTYTSLSVASITHTFNSLYSAINNGVSTSNYLNTNNLSNNGFKLNLPCYDDGVSENNSINISGWITDNHCNINIYTPIDVNSDCNTSQRHSGVAGSGYRIINNTDDSIIVNSVDFTTINGIQTSATHQLKNGIHIINSSYSTILNCISYICGQDGIFIESPKSQSKNYIINNLCYKNKNSGIHIGSYSSLCLGGQSYLYNNTCVNNYGKGIYVEKANLNNTHMINEINNLCQYNIGSDFTESNKYYLKNSYLSKCISSDDTSLIFNGSNNIANTYIKFNNVNNDIYKLDNNKDYIAINSANDLTSDVNYAFHTDIIGKYRFPLLWDVGAFESYQPKGSGNLLINSIDLNNAYGILHHDFSQYKILYLRNDKVGDNIFSNLYDLNQFLKINIFDSYIVYVQGSTTFNGIVDFGDRNIKSIIITTDPIDRKNGPATIVAAITNQSSNTIISGSNLISDTCNQKLLKFQDIRIQMLDQYYTNEIISNNSITNNIEFENCILQVNNDHVLDSILCDINIVNSLIVYRNTSNSNSLYISNNATALLNISNTIIITYNAATAMTFQSRPQINNDNIFNCLFYNFSGIGQSFNNSVSYDCLSSNPIFINNQSISEREFNIANVMQQSFKPQSISPCKNAGKVNGLSNDILGVTRYVIDYIDIGPYAINIIIISFDANKIKSLYQDKLIYKNLTPSYFTTLSRKTIYLNLPLKFNFNNNACLEYARESKIFIELKPNEQEYQLINDKYDILLTTFEAYYDSDKNTIIIKKSSDFNNNLFSKIFESDQYSFIFNEGLNLLYIYVKDTYNKGLSGYRNIVNNVRFGGQSIVSI